MGSTMVCPIYDERQQTIGSVGESVSGSGSLSDRCSLIHLGRSETDFVFPTKIGPNVSSGTLREPR